MNATDFRDTKTTRETIRRELDALPASARLTTEQMVEHVIRNLPEDQRLLGAAVYVAVRKKPRETFPGYSTAGVSRPGKGPMQGKMITPTLWHRNTLTPCPHCSGTGQKVLDSREAAAIS